MACSITAYKSVNSEIDVTLTLKSTYLLCSSFKRCLRPLYENRIIMCRLCVYKHKAFLIAVSVEAGETIYQHLQESPPSTNGDTTSKSAILGWTTEQQVFAIFPKRFLSRSVYR